MSEDWSTSGLDLHLDPSAPAKRAGLESALRDAIADGRLAAGARLPSTRVLAADLAIARGTATEAYAQLVAEGWLVARRGSGTRVAERPPRSVPAPLAPVGDRPAAHDLRAGAPDVAAFPRSAWLSSIRRALWAAPPDAFGYDHPQGRPELRAALAGYLGRARGVRADPERIVVCAGFAQALSLLCGVLARTGARTLAVERFGLAPHRAIATRAGLAIRALEVDDAGARVDHLADSGADALLLTPGHQFPLGMTLAPERRAEAIRWGDATDAVLIEDDYDGEFRYDRQPVGAMQGRAPDRVVYAGTASKSLAPGLRIAWLVIPESLRESVVAEQGLLRAGPGAVEQLALADLITNGGLDRHIRRARLVYRRRRDELVATIARAAPQAQVTGIAAGLHALVRLPGEPGGDDEARLLDAGAARGLALTGLSQFAHGDGPPGLVIGYGTPPAHAWTACLARLAATLGELRSTDTTSPGESLAGG